MTDQSLLDSFEYVVVLMLENRSFSAIYIRTAFHPGSNLQASWATT
jgi:hypothetical protein